MFYKSEILWNYYRKEINNDNHNASHYLNSSIRQKNIIITKIEHKINIIIMVIIIINLYYVNNDDDDDDDDDDDAH